MAKQKRGKALKLEKSWRGTCPICGRKRVKLAWRETGANGNQKICKICYARQNN